MKRRFGFSVLVTALFALAVVPVMAVQPLDVHIEVETLIGGTGSFIATGPAVDAGLMCSTGEVFDLSLSVSGPPGSTTFSILRVLKRFVCNDGSGTFDVRLVVRLDWITHKTTANWIVVGGTGDYIGLHSNGKLIGIPPTDPESEITILDIYDGRMH